MPTPYSNLPARSFWRTGVAAQVPESVSDLWQPKFSIGAADRIATAGSCFAQHIGRQLQERNYNLLVVERTPPGLSGEDARKFGYSIYSARYGNIYSVRQMLQLARETFGQFEPADAIWEKNGRYYDAMRPSVEPTGLASSEFVREHRRHHLAAVREVLTGADILIFTMGLTEAWIHRPSGTVYPTAPGVIAGRYDPSIHAFKNLSFNEIYDDFVQFRALLKTHRPNMKFILTVLPVPLTATASEQHVLVATTYFKSVLRAVAGALSEQYDDIDYFPAYEIIATPFARARFYQADQRSVTPDGVNAVMRVFFGNRSPSVGPIAVPESRLADAEDVVCEERLLEAFSR